MTIAIVYETLEGQTGKIAAFAADKLRKAGHQVTMIDTSDRMIQATFDDVETVILAAPVHERRHPKNFEVFVGASRDDLTSKKTMMISVSLSAAFPEGLEEAQEYLTEMTMRTKFKPDVEVLAAGAVQPSGYDYFQEQVIRHAVLGDRYYDLEDGHHEFTDWTALETQLSAFLG